MASVWPGGNTFIFAEVGSHGAPGMPSFAVWRMALAAAPGARVTVGPSLPSRWAGWPIWVPEASRIETPGKPRVSQVRLPVLCRISGW